MSATQSESRLIRTCEAARVLGVSVWTIRRMAQSGTLRPVKLGPRAHLRFRRRDLDDLIDNFKGDR